MSWENAKIKVRIEHVGTVHHPCCWVRARVLHDTLLAQHLVVHHRHSRDEEGPPVGVHGARGVGLREVHQLVSATPSPSPSSSAVTKLMVMELCRWWWRWWYEAFTLFRHKLTRTAGWKPSTVGHRDAVGRISTGWLGKGSTRVHGLIDAVRLVGWSELMGWERGVVAVHIQLGGTIRKSSTRGHVRFL